MEGEVRCQIEIFVLKQQPFIESTDGMMTLFLAPVLIMVLSDLLDRMGDRQVLFYGEILL